MCISVSFFLLTVEILISEWDSVNQADRNPNILYNLSFIEAEGCIFDIVLFF